MKIDIKKTCKSHGVSLVSLAERLGVSRQTVFLRRGGTAGPSADEYDHLPQVRDGAGDKRKGINKTTFL